MKRVGHTETSQLDDIAKCKEKIEPTESVDLHNGAGRNILIG